jgi:hypothetical protein
METIQYQSKALLARKEIRETKVNPAFLESRVSGVLVAVTELTEQMDRPEFKAILAFKVNREFRVSLELMEARANREFPEKSERLDLRAFLELMEVREFKDLLALKVSPALMGIRQ